MAVKLWSNRIEQFVDATGVPRSGAKLFTYVGGSVNTKQTTYTESTGSTPNTNPIVLDSSGRIPQPIWLTTGVSYKFVLAPPTDTDPPTSPIDTLDVITGINDSSASQSEWVSGPAPTFVSTTSFTLVGDQTTNFHVGRRLKTTNTSGTIYSTITVSAFAVMTTITVVNDSGVLDSGLSAVSYGLESATNPSDPLVADTYPLRSGSADKTKKVRIEVDGLTTATTRVLTVPDKDITLAGIVDFTGANGASWVQISTATASASASIDFTSGLTSTYDAYAVVLNAVTPATNNVALLLRISQATVFKSGANYRYANWSVNDAAASGTDAASGQTAISLIQGSSNSGTDSISGVLMLFNPSSASQYKFIHHQLTEIANGGSLAINIGGGSYTLDTGAIDGIRFIMSSGNITSGTLALYGIRKS